MITEVVTGNAGADAKEIAPFATFEEQAKAIVAEAHGITVTDATQVTLIKRSKELRLKAKHTRCALENVRKEKVEGLNRETKAINSDANKIKGQLETLEARLLENEEFAERAEAARILALRDSRLAELTPLLSAPCALDLGTMAEDAYAGLLADSRAMHAAKIEREERVAAEAAAKKKTDNLRADRRLEIAPYADFSAALSELDLGLMPEDQYLAALVTIKAAKQKADNEQEAQRVENVRLNRAIERERAISRYPLATAITRTTDLGSLDEDAFVALLKEFRDEHEAEAKRLKGIADAEEVERKTERDKAAADLKKSQNVAAALSLAADLEKAEKAQKELDRLAAERAAAAAPDREKIEALAEAFGAIELPEMATDAGRAAMRQIRGNQIEMVAYLQRKAVSL